MAHVIVVIPCYNEAARLDVTAFRDFARRESGIRFLFVNDGSTDETQSVLEELTVGAGDAFEVLSLHTNRGKAEAVRQGVLEACRRGADFIGYWDADLATPLPVITSFVELLQKRPDLTAALGSRVRLLGRRIDRSAKRHFAGRLFATSASLALRLPVYDTQCGAKLFRASPEVRHAFETPFRNRWIFDIEILGRLDRSARAAGSAVVESIVEVPLVEWRDVKGSKVGFVEGLSAFASLLPVWWECRRAAVHQSPAAPAVGDTLALPCDALGANHAGAVLRKV
jgi:glycosyltransferase involved in cell wall biosynthesis